MSVSKFFAEKQNQIDEMAGKSGVVQLREKLSQLKSVYADHQRNLGYDGYYKWISDTQKRRWKYKSYLKQHHIVTNEYCDFMTKYCAYTEKCADDKINAQLAASLYVPAWQRCGYGSLIHDKPQSGGYDYGRFNHIFEKSVESILTEYKSILHDLNTIPDEHGSWDRKGRGQQISIDLYGADFQQNLYVIQVRQAFRRAASHYLQTRKSYFLIGRNENGNAFAHCVGAGKIRAAINKEKWDENGNKTDPKTAVAAALKWIWQTDKIDDIIRHGDIALLPVGCDPNAPIIEHTKTMRVIDNHKLKATEIRKNGKLYAKNPKLTHLKNQHADVRARGWCEVIIGRREESWDFADESID